MTQNKANSNIYERKYFDKEASIDCVVDPEEENMWNILCVGCLTTKYLFILLLAPVSW